METVTMTAPPKPTSLKGYSPVIDHPGLRKWVLKELKGPEGVPLSPQAAAFLKNEFATQGFDFAIDALNIHFPDKMPRAKDFMIDVSAHHLPKSLEKAVNQPGIKQLNGILLKDMCLLGHERMEKGEDPHFEPLLQKYNAIIDAGVAWGKKASPPLSRWEQFKEAVADRLPRFNSGVRASIYYR